MQSFWIPSIGDCLFLLWDLEGYSEDLNTGSYLQSAEEVAGEASDYCSDVMKCV